MEHEETFCVLQPCFVYKIPPRSSTQGYKAADWDLEAPVWRGRLRVKAKGEKAFINLEDESTGDVYAVCNVDVDKQSESVEAVLDSSRYYVLRLEDERTKRHAYIGMGFHERDQSFEFKAALQDFTRRVTTERRLASEPRRELPKLDLTLKEGETINLDIKTGGKSSFAPVHDDYDDGDDGDDSFLPPPPQGNKKISSMSLKHPSRKPSGGATASPPQLNVTSAPASASTPSGNTNNHNSGVAASSDPYGLLSVLPIPSHVTHNNQGQPSPFSSPSIPHQQQPGQQNVDLQSQMRQQQYQQQYQQPGQQQQQQQQQYQYQQQPARVPMNQIQPGQQYTRPTYQPPPADDDPFSSLSMFGKK